MIYKKSFEFSVRIVRLCRYLTDKKNEHIMSKQLLRCGTSVGANIHEAQYAQSKADFVSKMSIALKEAGETEYWLKLMHETDYLTDGQFVSIFGDCSEIQKLLISIVKSSKNNC